MMSIKYLEGRIYRSTVRINKSLSKVAEYLMKPTAFLHTSNKSNMKCFKKRLTLTVTLKK